MARVTERGVDPQNAKQIADVLVELQQQLNRVEFGTFESGLQNIRGQWVEGEFQALDTELVFSHNLAWPIFNSEVNVQWILMGMRHDGTGATGASTLSINHEDGDTLTTNTIGLRLYSGGGHTIGAGNPVRVKLFFIPGTRWE